MDFSKLIKVPTSTVGLDIGSHSIKLVKINHRRDGYYLEAAGIKELEAETIKNGTIKKRDELIDAITTLVNQCDPSIVDVVISMSGQGLLSDKFNFKIDPDENAEELILWEAGQRSPFDVDDITLDYKILKKVDQSDNEYEVLLVAAKNLVMQSFIDLIYDAGLRPVIVDVAAFAAFNCYTLETFSQEDNGTVILLHIGSEMTTVIFIKDGIFHSSRDISTAGEFFNKTLRRNLGITSDAADLIIKGNKDEKLDEQMVSQSLDYAAEELTSGINLAWSYYKNSVKTDTIDKIIISGGGAYIPGIVSMLENRYDTQVQISNPLAYINYDPSLFGSTNPQNIASFLTVAIGLALRQVAD